MTPRPWFRSFGWTYRPIAWPGYLITALAAVFVAQALVAIDRQSHSASDTLFGIVPYDFRPPTWHRIRDAYWNPNSEHLFSDRVFGVGWALNLHRAKTLMEQAFGRLAGTPDALSIRMTVRSEGSSKHPDVVITRE